MPNSSSFLRPEAKAVIARWFEPAFWLFIIGVGIWVFTHTGWISKAIGGGLIFLGLALFVGALPKARRPDAAGAPGVVKITERELMYMGPLSGGTISLDGLLKVEIEITAEGPIGEDVFWHFADETGQTLTVPNGAVGTNGFFDALSPFPGVDYDAAIKALGSTTPGRVTIWSKGPGLARTH